MNDNKKKYIERWIEIADHDLGTAKIIFLHLPEYKEMICFHCQQAVEKYLKGYLTCLEIDFKKKHSLEYLLNLLSIKDEFSEDWYEMASKIENYAIEIRYPDETVLPTDEEVKESIEITEKFRELIYQKIKYE